MVRLVDRYPHSDAPPSTTVRPVTAVSLPAVKGGNVQNDATEAFYYAEMCPAPNECCVDPYVGVAVAGRLKAI